MTIQLILHSLPVLKCYDVIIGNMWLHSFHILLSCCHHQAATLISGNNKDLTIFDPLLEAVQAGEVVLVKL